MTDNSAQLEATTIHPATATVLASAFLGILIAVPVLQWLWRGEATLTSRELYPLYTLGSGQQTDPKTLLEGVGETFRATSGGTVAKTFAANRVLLRNFAAAERRLADSSPLLGHLAQPLQRWLLGSLGAGTEDVYVGRDHTLFYRPGIDSLTGCGFLQPATLSRRALSGPSWSVAIQPNPLPAIESFRSWLATQGVQLILMPTPIKPTVHPELFSARFDGLTTALHNPSFARFVAAVSASGVEVFDPSQQLIAAKNTPTGATTPQFLRADTHWTPEAMETVALQLSRVTEPFLRDSSLRRAFVAGEPKRISNRGDLARMTTLPDGDPVYGQQRVKVRPVTQTDGTPWRPDPQAEVLLLGDSFTNIYSAPALGWGKNAGLAEHLALRLGRPIDRLALNDNGAFATRLELRRLADRLTGKRVVIWQFASRELAVGDWRVFDALTR